MRKSRASTQHEEPRKERLPDLVVTSPLCLEQSVDARQPSSRELDTAETPRPCSSVHAGAFFCIACISSPPERSAHFQNPAAIAGLLYQSIDGHAPLAVGARIAVNEALDVVSVEVDI